MFQMMNRPVSVGAGRGHILGRLYAGLEYARERPQGRLKRQRTPAAPGTDHRARRREAPLAVPALLRRRRHVPAHAGLALRRLDESSRARTRSAPLLLDLLTPVVKSYPSEMGIFHQPRDAVLGGYGYSDEFPVEQYFRDIRIHPIHEGTTGIQAMDLLGRKVSQKKGEGLKAFVEEVEATMNSVADRPELTPYAARLKEALELLQSVTRAKLGLMKEGKVAVSLADACLYLELFGVVAVAWQWLKQGVAAAKALEGGVGESETNFYRGKLTTMRYFFHYELSKSKWLRPACWRTTALPRPCPRSISPTNSYSLNGVNHEDHKGRCCWLRRDGFGNRSTVCHERLWGGVSKKTKGFLRRDGCNSKGIVSAGKEEQAGC